MVLSSKTFRVFVSSTFSDLKEERNALQERVFPKLRKLCMDQGFRFQAIDLRWGVSEEASLDQQTMKICFEEIERSQKVSPKPNFIVLLGDRYGWQPVPYQIPAKEYEKIYKLVNDEERELLNQWFRRDDNEVPPLYDLKPRTGKYKDYNTWKKLESILISIIRKAVNQMDLDKNSRLKYFTSATEQEIIKGVLNPPENIPNPEEHVFCFFRKIEKAEKIPYTEYSKDYLEFNEKEQKINEKSRKKLKKLKKKLIQQLPSSHIFPYTAKWDGENVSTNHLDDLCEDVLSSLEKIIQEQIDQYEELEPLDQEIQAHKIFGKERSKHFIGRKETREKIKQYIKKTNKKPLILYGKSGSGKSALMAKAIEDLFPNYYEEKNSHHKIITRFIGATPETSDLRSLLESLSRQITKIYNKDKSNIPTEYNELIQDFKGRLKFATSQKPLFIFIDALDQLSDNKNAHNLTWIPHELPENVHIIITTQKKQFQNSIKHIIPLENTIEVLPLKKEDGKKILQSWLIEEKRKLTKEQENEVLTKFKENGLPLYLKLAFEEARRWKSYTPPTSLEPDIPGIIKQMLKRLSKPENHGKTLVSHSLGYLIAAKNGLTEDEILDILASDEKVFNQTKKIHKPPEEKLPVAVWSRLFFDLEPYLSERSVDDTSLISFYHRQIEEVAKKEYLKEDVKKQRHQIIAKYFNKQDLCFIKKDERTYNIRKISELPYQETYGEQWNKLEETLTNLNFIETKCAVGMTYDLIKDYNLALDFHPDAQEEKQKKVKFERSLEKYLKDLIDFSNGKIEHLDVISSIKPLIKEAKRKNGQICHKTRLDNIKVYSQFVKSQSHLLAEFEFLRGFCLQQAYNYAKSGFVVYQAEKIIKKTSKKLVLRHKNQLQDSSLIITLKGHKSTVNAVAITPDGKKAISGSNDHTIRVWDLENSVLLNTLKGHTDTIGTVAITPDGKIGISGSDDKSVRIWDLDTFRCIKTLKSHFTRLLKVYMAPDGKKAISGSSNGFISLWDLKTYKPITTLQHPIGLIDDFAVTQDFKTVIVSSYERETSAELVDIKRLKPIKTLHANIPHVRTIEITPDGKIAAMGTDKNILCLWNLETGKYQIIKIQRGRIEDIAITADGKKVVFASDNHRAYVYDFNNDMIKILESHSHMVMAVDITPDGRKAITGSEDHNIRLWDINSKSDYFHIDILDDRASGFLGKGFLGDIDNYFITTSEITPDGKKAITGSYDFTIRVWDLEHAEILKTIKLFKGPIKVLDLPEEFAEGGAYAIMTLDITPNGKIALIGNWDYSICLLDLVTFKPFKSLKGHLGLINIVLVNADGKTAITGSNDNTVRLWDIYSGQEILVIEGHNKIESLAVTIDGKKIITGNNNDKNAQIWDIETGKLIKTLKGHVNGITGIFTPDTKKIITKSYNKMMIWDSTTGKLIQTLNGHTQWVKSIKVTPDSKKLISICSRNLFIWDLETYKYKKIIEQKSDFSALTITPDGKTAITLNNDGIVHLWNLNNLKLISVYPENQYISMIIKNDSFLRISNDYLIFGNKHNNLIILRLKNILSLPLITAKRIWIPGKKGCSGRWDSDIKADCQFCGGLFRVFNELLIKIKEVEKQFKKPNGWIADEAWEDPRLVSECPYCNKKLRFNPFIVDNKES